MEGENHASLDFTIQESASREVEERETLPYEDASDAETLILESEESHEETPIREHEGKYPYLDLALFMYL